MGATRAVDLSIDSVCEVQFVKEWTGLYCEGIVQYIQRRNITGEELLVSVISGLIVSQETCVASV